MNWSSSRHSTLGILILAATLLATGCRVVSLTPEDLLISDRDDDKAANAKSSDRSDNAEQAVAKGGGIPPQDILEIQRELDGLREIDPAAYEEMSQAWKEQLVLFETETPTHWPELKQSFLAGVARRRSLVERQAARALARERARAHLAKKTEDKKVARSQARVKQAAEPVEATPEAALGYENATQLPPAPAERIVRDDASRTERSSIPRASSGPARLVMDTNNSGWLFPQEPKAARAASPAHVSQTPTRSSRQDDRYPVQPASHTASEPKSVAGYPGLKTRGSEDWRENLRRTIRALEDRTVSEDELGLTDRELTALRLLYLADGRRDHAIETSADQSASEQEFWAKTFYGLSIMMDEERSPDMRHRATEAVAELRDANRHLAQMGKLMASNLAFCTTIQSYGVYERFTNYRFQPGQMTLLYVEIDSFRSKETSKGHHLAFAGTYQILDKDGKSIVSQDLAKYEEYAKHPRRDFYMHYRIEMPRDLSPGMYTLQISLEDNVSFQIAQSTIDFEMIGSSQKKP